MSSGCYVDVAGAGPGERAVESNPQNKIFSHQCERSSASGGGLKLNPSPWQIEHCNNDTLSSPLPSSFVSPWLSLQKGT